MPRKDPRRNRRTALRRRLWRLGRDSGSSATPKPQLPLANTYARFGSPCDVSVITCAAGARSWHLELGVRSFLTQRRRDAEVFCGAGLARLRPPAVAMMSVKTGEKAGAPGTALVACCEGGVLSILKRPKRVNGHHWRRAARRKVLTVFVTTAWSQKARKNGKPCGLRGLCVSGGYGEIFSRFSRSPRFGLAVPSARRKRPS